MYFDIYRVLSLLGLLSVCSSSNLSWRYLNDISPRNRSIVYEFPEVVSKIESAWNLFKVEFKREYADGLEEIKRYYEFAKKYVSVMEHNLKYMKNETSYMMGINEFSDKFAHELSYLRGFRASPNVSHDFNYFQGSSYIEPEFIGPYPQSIDWRTRGAVTGVKNQGQCGSCWAFSTTGSLEGQHFRKTGKLVSLSEQQLVDCSNKFGDMGCNGGLMDNAFRYLMSSHRGDDTEDSYPYVSGDTGQAQPVCMYKESSVGSYVTGFVDIPHGNEDALQKAVANNGPVSVAIDASQPSFQAYQSGIYDEPQCRSRMEDLDHGVLVVGYGSEDGKDYWLVKNSWGPSWGENGYIRMTRNSNNQCGIATEASYPLV